MPKTKGFGVTVSYLPTFDSGSAVVVIGALKSVGEMGAEAEEIDSTTHDSPNGFREFVQGLKDSGEVPLVGFHDKTNAGQALCRTLFASGATGYWFVTFSDGAQVIFTAYVKKYAAGDAGIDGLVGFGATLRVTGIIQVISIADAIAQSKAVNATATLIATAVALSGTPTYQWKTCTDLAYAGAANVVGGTGPTTATYTTPALTPAGTKYYFCVITVAGYRPINGPIHVLTVA